MGKPQAARGFLEQLADYDHPAPKDFDPEKDHAEQDGTDIGTSEDEREDVREHYTDVGKSSLRNADSVDLGPQYSGASVSRNALQDTEIYVEDESVINVGEDGASEFDDEEVEAEDNPIQDFGRLLDDETNERYEDRHHASLEASPSTSSLSPEEGDQYHHDDMDDDESDSSSSPPATAQNDRAALRKLMADEQKSVAATLSAAASADIVKGKAIKQQRSTFDSLLSTRIKLQKALIASNSMAVALAPSTSDSTNLMEDCALASRAAEEAALNLWDSITSLRTTWLSDGAKPPLPRTTETSNQSLWRRTTSLDSEAGHRRRATLTKWSQRTNPVSTVRPQSRLLQTPAQQPLSSVLDQQLTGDNLARAIKRTRVARSCAPVQAASKLAVEDEEIYDDADFYSLLLRELVDRRMADTQSTHSVAPAPDLASVVPSRAELKVKKQVDTKASKGRKVRYTVHEKLQNFMAAEDRGSWGERQRAELFGSLLGRKVEMREIDEDDQEMEEDDEDIEAGGLKLFGR